MAIAKENNLVSSICIEKNIIPLSFYVMLCFCEMCFVFGCAKHLEPYYFFLSHQQHNNISGLAARYKIFGVNAHKEIIRFEIVCSSKYKIHVAVAFGGNAA